MKRALLNFPVLSAAVLSIAATVVISAWVFAEKPEPPTKMFVGNDVPAFKVTTHTGEVLTREKMLGEVWVCDFFFTKCNAICPRLGLTMSNIADKLGKDKTLEGVRLVSFSVDPENDTAQRLATYREQNKPVWDKGNDARWERINQRWVHARAQEREPFWEIVEKGFALPVGPSDNPNSPIGHSGKLVLVDRQGRIRGYYDGLTDEDLPALMADIRRLVNEPDTEPARASD